MALHTRLESKRRLGSCPVWILDQSVLIVILPIKPKANNATNQLGPLGVGTQGKNMYPTGANGGNTYSLWQERKNMPRGDKRGKLSDRLLSD